MDSEKENPLEELYVDADDFDRERLKEALSGLIGIDRESGEPRFYEGFEELNTNEKFVSLLLYRKSLESLGKLGDDEVLGESSSYFAEYLPVDSSTIRNKVGEIDFVENDEGRGGYLVPAHDIQRAVKYIERDEGR